MSTILPGTKPILNGAMAAILVENWRNWRAVEVGGAARNVRSIDVFEAKRASLKL
jgi:hypothetical protein